MQNTLLNNANNTGRPRYPYVLKPLETGLTGLHIVNTFEVVAGFQLDRYINHLWQNNKYQIELSFSKKKRLFWLF